MGAHRARRGVQATTRFAAVPVADVRVADVRVGEVPARPATGPAHARPVERQRALSAVAMTAVGAGAAVTMTGTLAAVPTVPPPPTPADTGTFAQPITLAADQAATPRPAQTAPAAPVVAAPAVAPAAGAAPAAVAAPVAPAGQATPLAAPASVIIGDAPSVVPAPDLAAPTAAVAPTALPVPAAAIAAIPAQAAAPAIEAIPAPALAAPAAQPRAVPAAQPLAAPTPAAPVAVAPAPIVQPATLAPAAAPDPATAPAAPVQQAKNIAAPGALGALATPAPAAAGGTIAAVDLHQTGANEIAALSRSIDIGQQAVQTAQAAAAQAAKPIFQGKPLPAAALEKAMSKIGRPYVWGAVGPSSFDCSGLVQWAYKQIGKDLPRTSRQQSQVGTPVSRDQLQPGDLVFFNSPVSHVGIYVGDNKILNAVETGRPVQITSMARQKFHNARRI